MHCLYKRNDIIRIKNDSDLIEVSLSEPHTGRTFV